MIEVDSRELAKLAAELKKFEPQLRKELARDLRRIAVVVRDDVRSAAPTHIRKAIKSQVRIGPKDVTIQIIGDVKIARDVWLWEKGGRHPVFGNRQVWVFQKARPYMDVTVAKHIPTVELAVTAAADKALAQSMK